MSNKKIITYLFDFGYCQKEIIIELTLPYLDFICCKKKGFSEWTRLQFNQCPNCPLNKEEHYYCPVAVNLREVAEDFNEYPSVQDVIISIFTENREFRKRVSLQRGLSSLFGIIMVTSGCPVLDKLRPMVYTHLPFATSVETTYRTVSMYLLAQYFLYKKGVSPDWDLKELVNICEEVKTVNKSFSQRIRSIQKKDANINSLTSLDCLAAITEFSISHNQLKEIESMFHSIIDESQASSRLP